MTLVGHEIIYMQNRKSQDCKNRLLHAGSRNYNGYVCMLCDELQKMKLNLSDTCLNLIIIFHIFSSGTVSVHTSVVSLCCHNIVCGLCEESP